MTMAVAPPPVLQMAAQPVSASWMPRVLPREILLMEEILHQPIGSLSHYLQGFIHARWCRIFSINSSSGLIKGIMKLTINGLMVNNILKVCWQFCWGVTVAFGEAAIKMFMMEIASLSLISGLLVGANARISRKQGSLKSPTPHVMKCEWPSWWWSDCILAWLIKHPKNVHAISCWVREGAKLGTNLALGGGGKTKQNLPFH